MTCREFPRTYSRHPTFSLHAMGGWGTVKIEILNDNYWNSEKDKAKRWNFSSGGPKGNATCWRRRMSLIVIALRGIDNWLKSPRSVAQELLLHGTVMILLLEGSKTSFSDTCTECQDNNYAYPVIPEVQLPFMRANKVNIASSHTKWLTV